MRAFVSVGLGALMVLVLGCGPSEDGILSAVRETLTQGASGEHAPEIQKLTLTKKKQLFRGESVWTADVTAEYRTGSGKAGEPGTLVKEPLRVVATHDGDGWRYQVQHGPALPVPVKPGAEESAEEAPSHG